jgi:hypothetical protein
MYYNMDPVQPVNPIKKISIINYLQTDLLDDRCLLGIQLSG